MQLFPLLRLYRLWCGLAGIMAFLLTACASGAVLVAPPPPTADASPLLYQHPGGVFTLTMPRLWAAYSQNLTTLASASFTPPNAESPLLQVIVINVGEKLSAQALADLMTSYQTTLRVDAGSCSTVSREAMGDGSWRLSGVCERLGVAQPINTFIQQAGTFLSVVDVTVPDDAAQQVELQGIINTLTINPSAVLNVTTTATLSQAASADLQTSHVTVWTTPLGVLFITGEVANRGLSAVAPVSVRAVLVNDDGLGVAEAVDMSMGRGLPPGGFAPFSLRFGQGRLPQSNQYKLFIGEQPLTAPDGGLVSEPELQWTQESSHEADGRMIFSGIVTNVSAVAVSSVQAIVTVFNAENQVIAAGFVDVATVMQPNERAAYQVVIPEIGASPTSFDVNIQGLT